VIQQANTSSAFGTFFPMNRDKCSGRRIVPCTLKNPEGFRNLQGLAGEVMKPVENNQ